MNKVERDQHRRRAKHPLTRILTAEKPMYVLPPEPTIGTEIEFTGPAIIEPQRSAVLLQDDTPRRPDVHETLPLTSFTASR